MEGVDKANMKWHGSTTGNLRGGKIQEDIDGLQKIYNVPKDYEKVFLSKKSRTQQEKNIFYYLEATALKMYEGAQKCEEEAVFYLREIIGSLYNENEELKEENERLQEEKEELEEKLEKLEKITSIINN
jgi:phosphoserine aminotransferase